MLSKFMSGVSAGILITIGGTVFLSCDNRYVGAVLFSVALLCICYKGYSLFTGKIGFIPENNSKPAHSVLWIGLLGNLVATIIGGTLIRYAITSVGNTAEQICFSKLELTIPEIFIRAIFCGILMYLAVSIFRDKQSIIGIIFCIPVFILSSFEHSIADMFYFSAAGILNLEAFVFIIIVLVGNAVGGMLLPLISMIGKGEKSNG